MSRYFLSMAILYAALMHSGFLFAAGVGPNPDLTRAAFDVYFDYCLSNARYDDLHEAFIRGPLSFNLRRFDVMWEKSWQLVSSSLEDPPKQAEILATAYLLFRIMLLAPEPFGSLTVVRAVRLFDNHKGNPSLEGTRIVTTVKYIIVMITELIKNDRIHITPALADRYRQLIVVMQRITTVPGSLRTRFFFTPFAAEIQRIIAGGMAGGAAAGAGAPGV